MFGDGKAAMDLMGEWLLGMQAPNSAERQGPSRATTSASCSFPTVPGGKGKATDTLGGINGFLVTKTAPPGGGRLPQILQPGEIRRRRPPRTAPISRSSRARRAAIDRPAGQALAADLAATTYHQNFFDQDLGPSVGRVVNDISVAVAAGEMKPEAAAAAIQDAGDQQ